MEDYEIVQFLIRIKEQNFGFNLEKGIKFVELDSGIEHFYMEIIKKE